MFLPRNAVIFALVSFELLAERLGKRKIGNWLVSNQPKNVTSGIVLIHVYPSSRCIVFVLNHCRASLYQEEGEIFACGVIIRRKLGFTTLMLLLLHYNF